jgi:predicted AlkP superfamily phosphohydrolase/phosphomutase
MVCSPVTITHAVGAPPLSITPDYGCSIEQSEGAVVYQWFASQEGSCIMSAKVLVIGLDGATPELVERWVGEGKLPHLSQMMTRGVYGTLKSTYPPISPAAWTTFATGYNPGKHGTYDFRNYDPRRYGCFADTIVDSRPLVGRTIWDIVGASGGKVGVITVPVTYPAWRVNGFMVSGYPTPDAAKSFAYPPEWGARIPPLTEDSTFFKSATHEQVLEELVRITHLRTDVSVAELRQDAYALFIMVIGATDRAHHDWWKYIDPAHPAYEAHEAAHYADYILRVYQAADACIGKLLDTVDEQTTTIVMSDHGGMAHPAYYFNTNHWLRSLGLLTVSAKQGSPRHAMMATIKSQYRSRIRALPYLERIYRRLPSRLRRIATTFDSRAMMNMDAIAWPTTKAYRFPMYPPVEGIMINVVGRQPAGCVAAGEEYEALRSQILAESQNVRDPRTGECIVVEAYRREELYHGERLEMAPDLILVTRDAYKGGVSIETLVEPVPHEVLAKLSGVHRMEGIILAQGPALRHNAIAEGARIVDVAPTILHLLDMAIPEDMDGEILAQLFEEADLVRSAAHYAPTRAHEDLADELTGYTPEEEETVRVKLEGLGYL